MFVAMTGTPMAIASMTTPPNGSGWADGSTKTSIAAYAGRGSAISPVKTTSSSSPASRTISCSTSRCASLPGNGAPTITYFAATPRFFKMAAALSSTSWPLRTSLIRPTQPTTGPAPSWCSARKAARCPVSSSANSARSKPLLITRTFRRSLNCSAIAPDTAMMRSEKPCIHIW